MNIIYFDAAAPVDALHRHYDGEQQPQPVNVELDIERHTLSVEVDGALGNAVPESVWHKRVLRFGIGFTPTPQAANEILEAVSGHVPDVLAGASIEWDGSNHVGTFSESAWAAMEAVQATIDSFADDPSLAIGTMDASDWFEVEGRSQVAERLGITAETSNAQLADLARDEEREALTLQEPAVLHRAEHYLTQLRNNLQDS